MHKLDHCSAKKNYQSLRINVRNVKAIVLFNVKYYWREVTERGLDCIQSTEILFTIF